MASSPRSPHLPQARVDVPAQGLDGERRLEGEQLGAAAHGGGADAHSRPDAVRAAEGVPRILARQVRADGQTVRVRRRHVLGGVDGGIDPPGEERLLDLLDEDAALADLPERLRAVPVARGRHRDDGDVDVEVHAPRSASAASSAWVSASLLPRLPSRTIVAPRARRGVARRPRTGRRRPRRQLPSCAPSAGAGASPRSGSSAPRRRAAGSARETPGALRRARAPRAGSTRPARAARRSRARRPARAARRGRRRPPRRRSPRHARPPRDGRRRSPQRPARGRRCRRGSSPRGR